MKFYELFIVAIFLLSINELSTGYHTEPNKMVYLRDRTYLRDVEPNPVLSCRVLEKLPPEEDLELPSPLFQPLPPLLPPQPLFPQLLLV